MKRYQIIEAGRECGPEFDTLEEARSALDIAIKEEMCRCRDVYGNALLRVLGQDSYKISPWSNGIWTTLSILS